MPWRLPLPAAPPAHLLGSVSSAGRAAVKMTIVQGLLHDHGQFGPHKGHFWP
jgi:hypothetical protein